MAFDALCADLFGTEAEVNSYAALTAQIARLEDSQREGMCAIRSALRILHIAVTDAMEANGEDPELKLRALVQLVGEAVSELDPDGEGVGGDDMSDSHE